MDAIQAAIDDLQTRGDALATREKEMDAREAAVKEREDEATEREQAIAVAVADLERREAMLVAERETLNVRLAAFEKQEELKIYLPDSDIIMLNVGGEYFTTYLSTMQKAEASMLGTMFSGRFDMPRDEHGRYFIDRPGKPFAVVLDLLRGVDPDFAVKNLVDKYSGVSIEAVARELEYYQLSEWTGSEAESAALASFADQCAALDETDFIATPQAGLFKWWKDAGRPDLGQHASTRFPLHRFRPPVDYDRHDPIGTIDDVDALAAEIQAAMGTRPSLTIAGTKKHSYPGPVTSLTCQVRSTTLRSLVDNLVVAWQAGRQGETVWWEGEAELWQRHGFCIVVAKGNLGAYAYVACVAFP